ncbi:MAG: site-specific integrase [Clostridia bacterium]|nr:site-specific integrase [Clostridia bacterium]
MAKRRGNGEGTIYKRSDGTWAGQVTVGYDPETGRPRRKSFYGRTRKEVADKMAEVLRSVRTGTYVEPVKTTLAEWLDCWLAGKKGQLKPSTFESYERLIDTHIKPALGKTPLAKLQAHMLQAFYNEKLERGRADGKGGLSTRMVRYLHTIIREALQQAVKEGLLPRNVADATSPPVAKSRPIRPLTEEELLIFFEAAKDDRLFPAYVLAATTGLRRGELLGLCWDSIDLEHGAIVVQRELLALKEGLFLQDTTKSKSGRRTVTLTDDAIRELRKWKARQNQERLMLGPAYQDNGLVFCREDGTPLDPSEFTKHFQRLLVKAGLPKVRLHDLRHTHASLLLARGVHPKVVQERLGHSSITLTLDLYSHLAPGLEEGAAHTLDGLLRKERGPARTQGQR